MDNHRRGGEMDDVDLYRTPDEVLRRELRYLKARAKDEAEELERYEAIRAEMGEELDGFVESVRRDLDATRKLASEYRRVIKGLKDA